MGDSPGVYERQRDPEVGVNLVSFTNLGSDGTRVFQDAVQDVFNHGIRSVSLIGIRFVDVRTGQIRQVTERSAGPDTAHLVAGMRRARQLGMTVTLNPFVEIDGFGGFRGNLNFSGAAAQRFFDDYESYIVEMATAAEAAGIQRLCIGSELRNLTADTRHNARWAEIIALADSAFSGELGYAANFDEYRNPNTTRVFWENPRIHFMGVDAYQGLVGSADAEGAGRPSVSQLQSSWSFVLREPTRGFAYGILEYARQLRSGQGIPVVFTEHGTIPYDQSTVNPFSDAARQSQPTDPDEQRNDYEALMRSLDGLRASSPAQGRVDAIYIWHWGMPGAQGSAWFLDPEGDDVREGARAARFLSQFASGGPETL